MSANNNPAALEYRDFVITRVFDAPRDLVWKAWTEPQHLSQWLSPGGASMRVAKMEFRPGGIFHYCMITTDGHEMWGKWTFREITAPERLVLNNSFSDAEGNITRHPLSATWPQEMLTTSVLAEQGDKTALTLTWSAKDCPEIERQTFLGAFAGMEQGWGSSFGQLDAYLEKIQKGVAATTKTNTNPEYVLEQIQKGASASSTGKTQADYPSDREMVFTRIFDAPRERVWEVWTKPEHIVRWLGPEGFTNTLLEMNVEPGGLLRLTMHGPDGTDYPNRMKFIEVVKPSRLVYDHGTDLEDDPQAFHVTTEFTDQGGKTKLVTRMQFKTVEQFEETRKYALEGHNSTMGRLDKLLAELQSNGQG